jgi:NAD(P)-dependent dehydrogenase (short-subunit alcohol dehydrogenase family)
MGILDGKVAIVTGAGRGIGRCHALALAGAGARVVVNDIGGTTAGDGHDQAPAVEVAGEIESFGGEAVSSFDDVSDFQAAERLVDCALESFGRLDILVNNAGILRDRMIVNMTEQEWDSVISVHLKGTFAATRHAAGYWRREFKAGKHVSGRVINTSSPSGLFGNIGQANYGAAKAGIAAFTEIAALELARYDVTVNAIAPNARTRMTQQAFGSLQPARPGFDAMDPANISPIVVALASDGARSITGQCFFVFGGMVNMLRPWDSGTIIKKEGRWEPEEFLVRLHEDLPHGVVPKGMIPMMIKANEGEGVEIG